MQVSRSRTCDSERESDEGHKIALTSLSMNDLHSPLVDYDSDGDESGPNEVHCPFSWRLPRDESMSDWTIEIAVIEGVEEALAGSHSQCAKIHYLNVYHVHKCVLGARHSRQSEYFACLFQNGRFLETQRSTSRIVLHELAAEAFPAMLDYMYHQSLPLTIDTKTATALNFLGRYFKNRQLLWDAKLFWKSDLTFTNCHIYCEHARVFRDEKISNAVASLCAHNFLFLDVSSPIIDVSEPSLWHRILQNLKKVDDETSRHASCIITEVCERHRDKLSCALFKSLIDIKFLPQIHECCAAQLLELYHYIVGSEDQDTNQFSNIQMRCIASLATSWRKLSFDKMESRSSLEKQRSDLIVELLVKVIQNARESLSQAEQVPKERHTTNPTRFF